MNKKEKEKIISQFEIIRKGSQQLPPELLRQKIIESLKLCHFSVEWQILNKFVNQVQKMYEWNKMMDKITIFKK